MDDDYSNDLTDDLFDEYHSQISVVRKSKDPYRTSMLLVPSQTDDWLDMLGREAFQNQHNRVAYNKKVAKVLNYLDNASTPNVATVSELYGYSGKNSFEDSKNFVSIALGKLQGAIDLSLTKPDLQKKIQDFKDTLTVITNGFDAVQMLLRVNAILGDMDHIINKLWVYGSDAPGWSSYVAYIRDYFQVETDNKASEALTQFVIGNSFYSTDFPLYWPVLGVLVKEHLFVAKVTSVINCWCTELGLDDKVCFHYVNVYNSIVNALITPCGDRRRDFYSFVKCQQQFNQLQSLRVSPFTGIQQFKTPLVGHEKVLQLHKLVSPKTKLKYGTCQLDSNFFKVIPHSLSSYSDAVLSEFSSSVTQNARKYFYGNATVSGQCRRLNVLFSVFDRVHSSVHSQYKTYDDFMSDYSKIVRTYFVTYYKNYGEIKPVLLNFIGKKPSVWKNYLDLSECDYNPINGRSSCGFPYPNSLKEEVEDLIFALADIIWERLRHSTIDDVIASFPWLSLWMLKSKCDAYKYSVPLDLNMSVEHNARENIDTEKCRSIFVANGVVSMCLQIVSSALSKTFSTCTTRINGSYPGMEGRIINLKNVCINSILNLLVNRLMLNGCFSDCSEEFMMIFSDNLTAGGFCLDRDIRVDEEIFDGCKFYGMLDGVHFATDTLKAGSYVYISADGKAFESCIDSDQIYYTLMELFKAVGLSLDKTLTLEEKHFLKFCDFCIRLGVVGNNVVFGTDLFRLPFNGSGNTFTFDINNVKMFVFAYHFFLLYDEAKDKAPDVPVKIFDLIVKASSKAGIILTFERIISYVKGYPILTEFDEEPLDIDFLGTCVTYIESDFSEFPPPGLSQVRRIYVPTLQLDRVTRAIIFDKGNDENKDITFAMKSLSLLYCGCIFDKRVAPDLVMCLLLNSNFIEKMATLSKLALEVLGPDITITKSKKSALSVLLQPFKDLVFGSDNMLLLVKDFTNSLTKLISQNFLMPGSTITSVGFDPDFAPYSKYLDRLQEVHLASIDTVNYKEVTSMLKKTNKMFTKSDPTSHQYTMASYNLTIATMLKRKAQDGIDSKILKIGDELVFELADSEKQYCSTMAKLISKPSSHLEERLLEMLRKNPTLSSSYGDYREKVKAERLHNLSVEKALSERTIFGKVSAPLQKSSVLTISMIKPVSGELVDRRINKNMSLVNKKLSQTPVGEDPLEHKFRYSHHSATPHGVVMAPGRLIPRVKLEGLSIREVNKKLSRMRETGMFNLAVVKDSMSRDADYRFNVNYIRDLLEFTAISHKPSQYSITLHRNFLAVVRTVQKRLSIILGSSQYEPYVHNYSSSRVKLIASLVRGEFKVLNAYGDLFSDQVVHDHSNYNLLKFTAEEIELTWVRIVTSLTRHQKRVSVARKLTNKDFSIHNMMGQMTAAKTQHIHPPLSHLQCLLCLLPPEEFEMSSDAILEDPLVAGVTFLVEPDTCITNLIRLNMNLSLLMREIVHCNTMSREAKEKLKKSKSNMIEDAEEEVLSESDDEATNEYSKCVVEYGTNDQVSSSSKAVSQFLTMVAVDCLNRFRASYIRVVDTDELCVLSNAIPKFIPTLNLPEPGGYAPQPFHEIVERSTMVHLQPLTFKSFSVYSTNKLEKLSEMPSRVEQYLATLYTLPSKVIDRLNVFMFRCKGKSVAHRDYASSNESLAYNASLYTEYEEGSSFKASVDAYFDVLDRHFMQISEKDKLFVRKWLTYYFSEVSFIPETEHDYNSYLRNYAAYPLSKFLDEILPTSLVSELVNANDDTEIFNRLSKFSNFLLFKSSHVYTEPLYTGFSGSEFTMIAMKDDFQCLYPNNLLRIVVSDQPEMNLQEPPVDDQLSNDSGLLPEDT